MMINPGINYELINGSPKKRFSAKNIKLAIVAITISIPLITLCFIAARLRMFGLLEDTAPETFLTKSGCANEEGVNALGVPRDQAAARLMEIIFNVTGNRNSQHAEGIANWDNYIPPFDLSEEDAHDLPVITTPDEDLASAYATLEFKKSIEDELGVEIFRMTENKLPLSVTKMLIAFARISDYHEDKAEDSSSANHFMSLITELEGKYEDVKLKYIGTDRDIINLTFEIYGTPYSMKRLNVKNSGLYGGVEFETFDSSYISEPDLAFKYTHGIGNQKKQTAWFVGNDPAVRLNTSSWHYSAASVRAMLSDLLQGIKYLHSRGYYMVNPLPTDLLVKINPDTQRIAGVTLMDLGKYIKPKNEAEISKYKDAEFKFVAKLIGELIGKNFVSNRAVDTTFVFSTDDNSVTLTTIANMKLVDLYFLASDPTKYSIKSVEDLLEHSLFTLKRLNRKDDEFGPRGYHEVKKTAANN